VKEPRADVFVSYRHHATSATWVHEVLVPALEAAGFSVLIDVEDFAAGGVLVNEMEAASARARVTLAIVDETYPVGGFVTLERHLAERLVAVKRAEVEPSVLAKAKTTGDLVGTDDPTAVVAAVRRVVRRVFILEAPEDEEWVDGVLLPTLDRTAASAEDTGSLVARQGWTDAVLDRMARADRVVVVLSGAYLRNVHPRAGTFLAHIEAEENRDVALPVRREADVAVPQVLRKYQVIDASRAELWDAALARICEAIDLELPPHGRPPPCPYPGMKPFSLPASAEREDQLFFGRDHDIDEVLSALRRRRFVAIIGPSASGKSSLALAGVAPALVARGTNEDQPWSVAVVRPGTSPRRSLDAAVTTWSGSASGARAGRRLLLVVDQLEELFAPDVDSRDDFEQELERLVHEEPLVYVVVTLRADFYPNVMSSALWPLVSASRVEVVPLRGDALRAAIREPARSRRVVVADALVERLAAETEGEPGLLPFLQETLVSLWDGLHHRLLTLEAYDLLGDAEGSGVLQAIRREADAAVGEIAARHPDGEQVVRRILLRLVQFGEGRPHTRRRLPVDDLRVAAPDDETFDSVFNTLVDRRLLTVEGEPTTTQHADLSHEAIIRGWPDLARWVEERRATEATRRRLLEDASAWAERAEQGHPEVGLLTSLDLADAERWRQSADALDLGVDPEINRFIDASASRAAARRRRRLLTAVAAVAALVLVAAVLAVTTVNARRAQRDAERASRERLALQLRAASAEFGDERLPLRALLVQAADQLDPTPLSLVEMLTTAERERLIAARIDTPTTRAGLDAMWVDRDVVVAGAGDGGVYVWRMAAGTPDLPAPPRTFELQHTPLTMVRRTGTDLLAVGGGDGSPEAGSFPGSNGGLDLVDLGASALAPQRVPLPGDSPVSAMVFAGDILLVGRWDGTITPLDLSQPGAPAVGTALTMPAAPASAAEVCRDRDDIGDQKVRALAVDDSGRWLAAGANNCVIAVWDRQAPDAPAQVLADHADKVRALAFVAGTTRLVSTGDDRSIRQWQVGPDTPVSTLLAAAADRQRVIAMCIAPDGQSLVTGGRDHQVRRWVLAGSTLTPDPTPLAGHGQTIRAVACSSGARFASLGADGLVLWDLDRPSRVGRRVGLSDAGVSDLQALAVRPGATGEVAAAATAPDTAATPGGVGALVVDRGDGAPRTVALGSTYPLSVDYSPDGAYLAVAGDTPDLTGFAAVYDANTLAKVTDGSSPTLKTLRAVTVLDKAHWAVGADDGTVEVHDGAEVHRSRVESGYPIRSLAYTPGGQLLVGDDTGVLSCYDPTRMDAAPAQRVLGRAIAGLDVDADGTVVAGTGDGFVAVFPSAVAAGEADGDCDPESWVRVDLVVNSDAVTAVGLAADGGLLVVATNDGTAELWDVQRRRRFGTLTLDQDGARASAAVDPSGAVIAAGTGRGVEVYSLDRDFLRGRLCALAGRQLTRDEVAAFLPGRDHQEAGTCSSVSAG
jgi:WD40 repeat protein